MQFRHDTLDNGLTVVAEVNPDAYSSALGFFVKSGARDETDEVSGVSHFLEHMAFKGTPRRTAAQVNADLDRIGSHANAFTSEEQTVYHAAVLPEYLDDALDVLSDMMRPALRTDDFEMEKKVIIEEIRKYDDQPPFGAYEKAMAAHFGPHPLGRSVLGTEKSIEQMKPEDMRTYFERRYSPANITLVAAGNVDFDALRKVAADRCGAWPAFDAGRETPPAEPIGGVTVIEKPQSSQQYAFRLMPGPATDDDRRFAARVLATIIGDDSGSRFHWELTDPGLAEFAAMSCDEYQGAGVVYTYFGCRPDQLADNLKRVDAINEDVTKNGVTEEELMRAIAKVIAFVTLRSERPANRLFAIGNAWTQRGEYRSVAETLDIYRGVTLDKIRAYLFDFPLANVTTVVAGPLTELAE